MKQDINFTCIPQLVNQSTELKNIDKSSSQPLKAG